MKFYYSNLFHGRMLYSISESILFDTQIKGGKNVIRYYVVPDIYDFEF